MKTWIIRMLLRLLGVKVDTPLPLEFYAVIIPGERLGEVTTILPKAVAYAKQYCGEVWICKPVEQVKF